MPFLRLAVLSVSFLFATSIAQAQSFRAEAARAAREARQDARDTPSVPESRDLVRPEPKLQLTDALIGFSRDTDSSDTRTIVTPFVIGLNFNRLSAWRLQLSGAGYTRISPPGADDASGFSNVLLDASRKIIPRLTGQFGITLPSDGDVGSRTTRQRIKLSWADGIGGAPTAWGYKLSGKLTHVNGAPAGISSYAQVAYGELSYVPANDQKFIFSATRSRRGGQGSATDLAGEYDFPIAGKWSGAASIARGITSGSQHTGIEFDLIWSLN